MNSLHDTPQTNTKLTTITPVNTPQAHDLRAERVRLIFEKKYELYHMLAYRYVKSMEDARDIVLEVIEGASKNWPTEQYEAIRDLEAYMCQSVKHKAINFAKKQVRMVFTHEFPIDTFSISNPMENFDIQTIIQQLPPKQRAAFALFMEGDSHEDIAEQLSITEGASKNLVYYAKIKLKKLLSEFLDFDPDDRGPSATRGRKAKQTANKNRTNLQSNSGSTPKVKDLLNYLNGYELKASNKKNILQWLVYQEFAFEIISGLKLALNNHNAADIVAGLKKDKDSLRAQLFGTSSNHEQSNKSEYISDSINKWDLSVYRFNHKIEQCESPSTHENNCINNAWIETPREILLNLNKNNDLNNNEAIEEQNIASNIRSSLPYNISPRTKNSCTLNHSNNHPLNNQNHLSDWKQNLSACSAFFFNHNKIQFYQLHFNIVQNTIQSKISFIQFNSEALQNLLSIGCDLPCDKPAHKFQFTVYQIEKDLVSNTHKNQLNTSKTSAYLCLQDSNVTDTLSEQTTWNSLPIKEGKKNE